MLRREQILLLTLFLSFFPRPDHVTNDCVHLPGDDILADSVYVLLSQLCVDGISYILLLIRGIGGVRLAWMGLDALFGKRTEVKGAHDRYANLEISYLLERMERFKGLAILATNRKKDLDEAFLRRLRFVIEFPLPGAAERLRIWRSVIPNDVDVSEVDFEFLAQRFALAGGHIRAIVFQACLQSAGSGA